MSYNFEKAVSKFPNFSGGGHLGPHNVKCVYAQ